MLNSQFFCIDAIHSRLNAVNESLTSDLTTFHTDLDTVKLKHQQAIGKPLFKFKNDMIFCSIYDFLRVTDVRRSKLRFFCKF